MMLYVLVDLIFFSTLFDSVITSWIKNKTY